MKSKELIEQQLSSLTKQRMELLREKEQSPFFYMQKGRQLEAITTSIKTLKWALSVTNKNLQL